MESSPERSPAARVACLALTASPTAPFWARWQARLVLDWWGIRGEAAETVILLVSEMVTNATRACTPATAGSRYSELASAECIALTLTHLGREVRIEVADPSTDPPVLCNTGPDAESGRGLMLVDALSLEWSYFYPPMGGKVIYAFIDVSGAHENGSERKPRGERRIHGAVVAPTGASDSESTRKGGVT